MSESVTLVPITAECPSLNTIDHPSNKEEIPQVPKSPMTFLTFTNGPSHNEMTPSTLNPYKTNMLHIESTSFITTNPPIPQFLSLCLILCWSQHLVMTTLTLLLITLWVPVWHVSPWDNPTKSYMHMILNYNKTSPSSFHSSRSSPNNLTSLNPTKTKWRNEAKAPQN